MFQEFDTMLQILPTVLQCLPKYIGLKFDSGHSDDYFIL